MADAGPQPGVFKKGRQARGGRGGRGGRRASATPKGAATSPPVDDEAEREAAATSPPVDDEAEREAAATSPPVDDEAEALWAAAMPEQAAVRSKGAPKPAKPAPVRDNVKTANASQVTRDKTNQGLLASCALGRELFALMLPEDSLVPSDWYVRTGSGVQAGRLAIIKNGAPKTFCLAKLMITELVTRLEAMTAHALSLALASDPACTEASLIENLRKKHNMPWERLQDEVKRQYRDVLATAAAAEAPAPEPAPEEGGPE
jgi:hypothetical protein